MRASFPRSDLVLSDLLPQNSGGGGTAAEGLQLGRRLCSCAQLCMQVAARRCLANVFPPLCQLLGQGRPHGNRPEHGAGSHAPHIKGWIPPRGAARGIEPQSRACSWLGEGAEGREAQRGVERVEGGSRPARFGMAWGLEPLDTGASCVLEC